MSDTHDHTMRLQRYLARSGVASRRGSEKLISEGRVTVNGHVTVELGTKVNCERDIIAVDGSKVQYAQESANLMLYKPKGYLSTMHDPYGRACVADLVPVSEYPGLFCVGRLDKDTTGLLLFTTDGDLAEHLLHPRFQKEKSYLLLVEGQLKASNIEKLQKGILLEDGLTFPAHVELHPKVPDELRKSFQAHGTYTQALNLTIHEGKKHIIKRMLDALGHPVLELHRFAFGPLMLKDISPGGCRMLTKDETIQLKRACQSNLLK